MRNINATINATISSERLSLRKAALELGTDVRFLSGFVRAMDIAPLAIGRSHTITREELERVKARLGSSRLLT